MYNLLIFINFVLISSGKTKFSMASCTLYVGILTISFPAEVGGPWVVLHHTFGKTLSGSNSVNLYEELVTPHNYPNDSL